MTDAHPAAAELIKALGGRGSMARCPAHDDRTPSLSVCEKAGKILFKCHAGCSQEDVLDELRRRGLWPNGAGCANKFDFDLDRVKKAQEAERIYQAAIEVPLDGPAPVYIKSRGLDPTADFPGLRWNTKEGCLVVPTGATGIQRIFLDRNGKQTSKLSLGPMGSGWQMKRDNAIGTHVCEGPEDAMTVFQYTTEANVIATCGQGNLRGAARIVRTPEVCIVQDADTDRHNLDKLVQVLHRGGRTVFVVSMPSGRKDINEVLQKDGPERTWEVLQQQTKVSIEDTVSADINLSDWSIERAYTGAPPEEQPVVKGLFMRQTAAVLAGIGGAGKTDIVIELGIRIATNEDGEQNWLGYPVMEQGSAVILTAEDNQASIHQRIRKLAPMLDTSSAKSKVIVVPIPNVPNLGSVALLDKDAQPTDLFRRLGDQITKLDDAMIFALDPLRSFCRADINSDPEMATEALRHLNTFATEHNILVLLSHHLRKAGLQASNAIEAREAIQGVSGIVDHARAAFALWMPKKDKGTDILRQLAMLDPTEPAFRVFFGALVKANHPHADYGTKTLVRIDRDWLVDFTAKIAGEEVEELTKDEYDARLADLLQCIKARAETGRPFKNSNREPDGIFHKDNIDRLKANGKRIGNKKAIADLIESLSTRGFIKFVTKGGGAQWIKPT